MSNNRHGFTPLEISKITSKSNPDIANKLPFLSLHRIGRSSSRDDLSLTGFTLVEVMVALVIVSFSLVFIYASFTTTSDTLIRMDNHNRSVILTLEQFWALENEMMQSDEVKAEDFSGDFKDDLRSFAWHFKEEELEDYPGLKEIQYEIWWQQGKRKGGFEAGTYIRQKEEEK